MAKRTEAASDQILSAFQRLVAKHDKLASRIVTKEEAAEREKESEIVSIASTYTVEGIIKGLADLQLGFGRETEQLADTLVVEASKLDQVSRAIEIETEHLQQLADTEIAANAIDVLVQGKQTEAKTFEEQCAQERMKFEQVVAAQREAWQKEEQEHQHTMADYEKTLLRTRSQAEAAFIYELERKRSTELDKFEAEKRRQEREIGQTEQEKHKQWAEREQAIAAHQEELEGYRAREESLPQELAEAVQQARESAFQAASEEARFKTALLEKEIEANRQVQDLNIQTLQETISEQDKQIQLLSAELKKVLEQAQTLASQAIGAATLP